jgi:hypothetical protein
MCYLYGNILFSSNQPTIQKYSNNNNKPFKKTFADKCVDFNLMNEEDEEDDYDDDEDNDDNNNNESDDGSDYDDEETQVREVSELLDVAGSYNTKKTDTHVAFFMNFDEKIYNELKRIFGGLNTKDNFGNEIKILLTDNKTKIALVLPLSWEDKLFGEDV